MELSGVLHSITIIFLFLLTTICYIKFLFNYLKKKKKPKYILFYINRVLKCIRYAYCVRLFIMLKVPIIIRR